MTKLTANLSATLLILLLSVGATFSQDAQEIIKKTQETYSGLDNAKATFSQSTKYSSGKSENSSGTLYVKGDDMYRIETSGRVVVTDGKTSWSYSPKKKQVVIDNYKDDKYTFSPNKFLFDYPKEFYSDLEGEANLKGFDCFVLKLTPRNKGTVKSAKIWIDKNDYIIRKITISDSNGSTTYTLNKITFNPGVSSSKFTFDTPSGVDVIDLR
ncbi:MAG: outer membrane lipoprotein chaperone LolA [Ignavibacteriae bacterium]|nr:outer membrane lipoprotein chaperone LolA [Ignavibacteriota bacterium]